MVAISIAVASAPVSEQETSVKSETGMRAHTLIKAGQRDSTRVRRLRTAQDNLAAPLVCRPATNGAKNDARDVWSWWSAVAVSSPAHPHTLDAVEEANLGGIRVAQVTVPRRQSQHVASHCAVEASVATVSVLWWHERAKDSPIQDLALQAAVQSAAWNRPQA